MKQQVDETTSWWNNKLMKQQVDEATSWWNNKLTKWQIDRMISWWKGRAPIDSCSRKIPLNCQCCKTFLYHILRTNKLERLSLASLKTYSYTYRNLHILTHRLSLQRLLLSSNFRCWPNLQKSGMLFWSHFVESLELDLAIQQIHFSYKHSSLLVMDTNYKEIII